MRNKLLCLLIGLPLIAFPLLAQDDAYSNYEKSSAASVTAWISYIEGDAKLNTTVAETNARIIEGDELYTQEGRVEVYLGGNFLRLNHHTKVVFAALGEESILVDVRYGEVYIQSERTIDFQTPHENFSTQGVYRIEVDRYDTKKFHNPMYDDNFDKWSYWREQEAERERYLAEEYEEEEPYRRRTSVYVVGGAWDPWFHHWGWYPYWYWTDWGYGWHSYWYWSSWYYGWNPYFYWTNWYRYSYYPYYNNYYYGYGDYYYRGYRRYVVHKDQLKSKTPRNLGANRIRTTTGTATKTTKGKQPARVSKSKGIKSTPSRGTIRRTVPARSATVKKNKISSSRLGSIGNIYIYPSRIQTGAKTSIKKSSYSKYGKSLKSSSRYRSPKISTRSYTSRSSSRPSISRSSSRSSGRSISSSSRSGSSGRVRKR
jgi:hypothetical protein